MNIFFEDKKAYMSNFTYLSIDIELHWFAHLNQKTYSFVCGFLYSEKKSSCFVIFLSN